jgi:predicted ATP-grasp superfamily ATP-dependent carboligase
MKILVSQSGMKHSVGMIRSLARQGNAVYGLVDPTEKQPLSRYSRYCKGLFTVDQENETAFINGLSSLLSSQTFDVFIPVGFPVTHFTAKHHASIERHTHIVAPDALSEETASDKYAIQAVAQRAGVPVPKTFLIRDAGDITHAVDAVGLPVVIKGRKESGKGIVAIASNKEEAVEQFGRLVAKFSLTAEDYPILQEFIPGWGCGFFAIYSKGQCKRIFMHRRIREYPPSGGVSCCAETYDDARLAEYGRRILDELRWNGVAMVEFRYDERTHDYVLIEINAKFWGSLELALAAGADFPSDYVKIAAGQEIEATKSNEQTSYQWFLSGDFLHGLRRPSALPAVIGTALNPAVHKDFMVIDDPKVLFIKVVKLFKEIVNLLLQAL